MAGNRNPDFMNGVPELLVLRLLKEREMYGYDLVSAIREATGGEIALGEGVIYPTLHELEAGGFLCARRKAVNGRTRIYYGLTPKGNQRLKERITRWSRLTTAIATCMQGEKAHGTV
jgi:PadR family transcriptional regulator PadR